MKWIRVEIRRMEMHRRRIELPWNRVERMRIGEEKNCEEQNGYGMELLSDAMERRGDKQLWICYEENSYGRERRDVVSKSVGIAEKRTAMQRKRIAGRCEGTAKEKR